LKRIVPFNKIQSVKKNSNFFYNDGHWVVFLHENDNTLEVNLIDTTCELIDAKLHTKCISGQKELLALDNNE
tara:strand:+ start:268 stop:483 length:216 start_codon:yes stop_codon:yes gene_type:complete